jgi:hypothetical protein
VSNPFELLLAEAYRAPGAREHRRFANRVEILEGPFERRIQQFETEIDFGLGRRQWRGNAHDPTDEVAC